MVKALWLLQGHNELPGTRGGGALGVLGQRQCAAAVHSGVMLSMAQSRCCFACVPQDQCWDGGVHQGDAECGCGMPEAPVLAGKGTSHSPPQAPSPFPSRPPHWHSPCPRVAPGPAHRTPRRYAAKCIVRVPCHRACFGTGLVLIATLQKRDWPYNAEPQLVGRELRLPKGPRRKLVTLKLVMKQLLEDLAACHATGIVHRDVKPQNAIVSVRDQRVKLIDLGAAADLRIGINYVPSEYLMVRAPQRPGARGSMCSLCCGPSRAP